MDDSFADEISKALDHDLAKIPPRPVSARKPEATSLTEQWMLSEKIKYELCDRLRKERQKLQTDHDTQWLELRHRYEERISNTIADMRAELAAEQRRLVESYQERARELDLLSKKVEGDGYGPL